MKLTKNKIHQMANEIYNYLHAYGMMNSVCIYYNNKRMMNNDGQKVIEDNINQLDYFQYAAKHHILSMSFEGALYRSINYGIGCPKLEAIFEKYGVYYELGNAWNLTVFPIHDDVEVEYTEYFIEEEHHIYLGCKDVPNELESIMTTWNILSDAVGDSGSCVSGAGFKFHYQGKKYFMSACSPWQGSCSWESCKGIIEEMLKDAGATSINYCWGTLD